ncbi:MAG: hypothetical protein ACLQLG_05480 [Thermoguttaceae bacterium]
MVGHAQSREKKLTDEDILSVVKEQAKALNLSPGFDKLQLLFNQPE